MFVRIGEKHVNISEIKEFEVLSAAKVNLVIRDEYGEGEFTVSAITLTDDEAFMFLHDIKRLGLTSDLNYSSGLEGIWDRDKHIKSII